MKIALINDTHFGARSDSSHFNEFFFQFWDTTFFPYLHDHHIQTVVHLGDTVDRRKFINHQIAHDFQTRFIQRFRDEHIDIHFIIGNHDTYYKNTNKVNAITNLCASSAVSPKLMIYADPEVVVFDDLPILFLPWICDDNRDRSLDLIRTASTSIVMGHLEISGFEMDRGLVCKDGMPIDEFKRFELVMSGHFHHRSHREPIHYLGNQYEITWSDYNDQRGFHVFDTSTRDLTFIPNPHQMFYKLEYDDSVQTMEYWNQFSWSVYKNKCVKIIVRQKQNSLLFDRVLDNLYAQSPFDVSIVENYLPDHEIQLNDVNQAEDTMTIVSKYIDGLQLDVDAEKLKRLMMTLYQDALQTEQSL